MFSQIFSANAASETPKHIEALLSFRESARDNPVDPTKLKISNTKFLEAIELVTKSIHPFAVAHDRYLSPFTPYGDFSSLSEQFSISRNQAWETLWKIEDDELLEPWECTFARFEHALQKESRSRVLREARSSTKGFVVVFVIAAILFLISLFLSSTNSFPFQFLGAVVILFALPFGKGLLKLISFKIRGDDRTFSELHRIKRLIDKANCG